MSRKFKLVYPEKSTGQWIKVRHIREETPSNSVIIRVLYRCSECGNPVWEKLGNPLPLTCPGCGAELEPEIHLY